MPVATWLTSTTDNVTGTAFDYLMAELSGQPDNRERMIEVGLPLAVRIARHYQGRGEPFDDLVQVATIGLIKAIDGYDADRGPFSHYAAPTVRGELKKHFRDRGWSIRVPRRLQELKIEMSRAHQVLTHQLGRAPSVPELAAYLGADEELVIEGLDLDPAVESLDDRVTLATLLPELPEREQRILHMRFSGNMTQSEIAAEIGISQMHVSRLLAQSLAWLREAMTGDVPPVWPGTAAGSAEPGAHVQVQGLPGGTVLVVVAGEVDHDSAPQLRTALCETAVADRPTRVRVDLADVPVLDAAGIGALVAGYRAAHRGGAGFAVERSRRSVADAITRAGLGQLFGVGRLSAPSR